jgi:hypothetical protein
MMTTTKLLTKESVTFRIDSDAAQELRKNALDEGITLNTLVNHILTDYLEWEGNAVVSKRFVVVERNALKELIEATESNILSKIAASAAKGLKEAMLAMRGKANPESALKILKHIARKSRFSLTKHEVDGRIVYVLQHDMGKKWSEFCKEQIDRMMIDLGHPVRIDSTDRILTITILS